MVDLNVYGARLIDNGSYVQAERANAYLDSGKKAGLGVCGTLLAQQEGTNWCNPSSDDNLQANEVLGFVFDTEKKISNVGINAPHADMADGSKVLIWTDTQGFDLLSVVAGKITLGFELTEMAIFGPMSGWYAKQWKWGQGTAALTLVCCWYQCRANSCCCMVVWLCTVRSYWFTSPQGSRLKP